MGLSPEALRKRIQRGNLQGYKQDGRWFVVLPPGNVTYVQRQDIGLDVSGQQQDARPDIERQHLEAELTRERLEKETAQAEIAAAMQEIAAMRDALGKAEITAAVAQAEVRRLETNLQDLRDQNANLNTALDQEQRLHAELQRRLTLPAPEQLRKGWHWPWQRGN
jgi:septal ring factor EnvC (AmiA/AmiB activator)